MLFIPHCLQHAHGALARTRRFYRLELYSMHLGLGCTSAFGAALGTGAALDGALRAALATGAALGAALGAVLGFVGNLTLLGQKGESASYAGFAQRSFFCSSAGQLGGLGSCSARAAVRARGTA